MSFFKNIEAGLNSGLDALAQEYSKLDNQPAGGGSGSREEGGGSSSAEEASGSVGQRVSALLNAIEPGSLSNLEQSASGALKAFTPKLPVTPSLKLPSTDGLFPGFPGDAATEDEDKVTAAAATETNASPPEAAEAARRIAEAEARAAAAEERAAAAEQRAKDAGALSSPAAPRAVSSNQGVWGWGLFRARSRLYRRRCLQPNPLFSASVEIYMIIYDYQIYMVNELKFQKKCRFSRGLILHSPGFCKKCYSFIKLYVFE